VLSAKGGEESPSDECEAENPILQLQEAVNRVTNECPWALDQTPEVRFVGYACGVSHRLIVIESVVHVGKALCVRDACIRIQS